MVMPNVHIWDIEGVQYRNDKKQFLSHGKELNQDSSVLTLGKWNKDSSIDWYLMYEITKSIYINHTVICTNPDMSYTLNVMSIYQNDS